MEHHNKNRAAMRNTAAFILLALCVLLSLLNNWRLEALETQLGYLQSTLSMQISNMNYDVASISDRVRAEIEKETSIVSSGSMDISLSSGGVRADAWVAPRELRAGEEVSIVFYIDGTPKPVKAVRQEGGRYLAGIDVPPCGMLEAAIVLESGQATRQERFVTADVREYTSVFANCSHYERSLVFDLFNKLQNIEGFSLRLIKEDTSEQYPVSHMEGGKYSIELDAIGAEFEGFFRLEAALGDAMVFRSDPVALTRSAHDENYYIGDLQLYLSRWE